MSALITSHQNARVKELRAALSNHTRCERIAVEGEHLVQEALRSDITDGLLFLRESYSLRIKIPAGLEAIHLSKDVFDKAVATEAPQGIALLFHPPAPAAKPGPALILIAAGLQDPGNLGTLIRSAEAFGATQCITTAETVSPWNQKAIRSSAGSVFRMPLALSQPLSAIASLKQRGIKIFAAAADAAEPFTTADLTTPCALMIGNEGAGLARELLARADARLAIPMPGAVESLNAAIAGSLLLYESARQRAEASRRRAASNR